MPRKPLLEYIAVIALFAVFTASCGGVLPVHGGEGKNPFTDDYYKNFSQSNTQNHEAGTIESIIQYGEHSVIGAHYPVFDNDSLDDPILEFVTEIISRFVNEVEGFEAVQADRKAELNIDYETWLLLDRFVSVKFTVFENMPHSAHPSVQTVTALYDLHTGQRYYLEDLLDRNGLETLAHLVRDKLKENPDYGEYTQDDAFFEGTEPTYDNYSRFALTREGVIFTFEKYQIFPGVAGSPSVTIPYSELVGTIDPASPESLLKPKTPLYPGPREPRDIDPDKPMVALTFDDGPFSRTTTAILDTLKEHNAVATFFVLGNRVLSNEALILRMAEEGHQIGNHSYNHRQLTTLSERELRDQIDMTQNVVEEVTGKSPLVVRPTYGSYNKRLRDEIGLPMILWSVDPYDWNTEDPSRVIQWVFERVGDGDIILLHDIYVSTAQAVKTLVPELQNRGFQLVTVEELFQFKGISLVPGHVYNKGK